MSDQDLGVELALERGKAAMKSGDTASVREHLLPLAESGVDDRAILMLARAEFEASHIEDARLWLDRFREKKKKHVGGLVLEGQVLFAEGRFDEAQTAAQQALEQKPDNPQAQRLMADLQVNHDRGLAETLLALLSDRNEDTRQDPPVPELADAARTLAGLTPAQDWNDDPFAAKIAFFANAPDPVAALRNYDAHLIEISVAFGYVNWPKRIQEHVKHKSVLDVGCGFGGYGMGFLIAGAKDYVGLDPVMDLDSTFAKNKRRNEGADMGVTPRQIADALPAIRLYHSASEDLALDETFDTIALHNVTEHLLNLDLVFKGLAERLNPGGCMVYLHHNFYCWNGHHSWDWSTRLRFANELDLTNPDHRQIYDWRHIDIAEDMPADHYFNTGLNRVRLHEIREITARYFDIEVWEPVPSKPATLRRFTPEVLARVQAKYPDIEEHELTTNVIFCVARAKSA